MLQQLLQKPVTPAQAPVGERSVNLSAGGTSHVVSSQWHARPADQRFLSLAELHAATKLRHDGSAAKIADNRTVEFVAPEQVESLDDARDLKVQLRDGTIVEPSHWSFGQLCGLAKSPGSYLRSLPSQITADCLNWSLRRARSVEQVKLYFEKGGGELYAATGPTYGRIPDHEVVTAVRQIADANGFKVPGTMERMGVYDPNAPVTEQSTTLYASDRDVFMFLVDDQHPIKVGTLPDGNPDYLFRGFLVSNSEVGSRSLQVLTAYLRAVCMNRILWGVEGRQEIKIRHSRFAATRFASEAIPALRAFADRTAKGVEDGVRAAQEARIAGDDSEALAFLNARGLSQRRSKAILEAVEREEQRPLRTAWDAAQGITAFARDLPHQSERVDLERVAGAVLDKVAKAA